MDQNSKSFASSFVRKYFVPVLLIFFLPGISTWFYGYAVTHIDDEFITNTLASIDSTDKIPVEQKPAYKDFYRSNPPSTICKSDDPKNADLKKDFNSVCSDFRLFELLRLLGQCLSGLGVFSLIFISILAGLSFRNQKWQYGTFLTGYHFSKVVSLVQVTGQGILAVSLAYYGTVIWTNSYYPKLIFLAAALAVVAIFGIIKIVLSKVNPLFALDAETNHLLVEQGSEEFFARIRQICKDMNTLPPNHILLGIDDNFFVTELNIKLGSSLLAGRTLYASLFQLRNLSKHEADAIFAHEMAHFSGQDTLYSQKTAPLLQKANSLLDLLKTNILTLPIFFFMNLFMSLFYISLQKISRQRELRADKLASQIASGEGLAHGLLKVVGFSHFRNGLEKNLFSLQTKIEGQEIFSSIRTAFQNSLTDAVGAEVLSKQVSHPFDSHPSLVERLKHLDINIAAQDVPEIVKTVPAEHWFGEIANAEHIESSLIRAYENQFKQNHELSLAYRYLPKTEEETLLVEKYFPPVTITGKDNKTITIDCNKISCSEWDSPIMFANLKKIQHMDKTFTAWLQFTQTDVVPKKQRSSEIKLRPFSAVKAHLIDTLNRYYGRYLYAKTANEKTDSKSP